MTHIDVLKQAKEALTAALSVGEIHFRTCVLSSQVNDQATAALAAINTLPTEIGETSDGYHTFDELYEHRFELWMALCKLHGDCWCAVNNFDGTFYEGWFLLGIYKPEMTYHLPIRLWDRCDFAETHLKAPQFDGHTSADVLERLRTL